MKRINNKFPQTKKKGTTTFFNSINKRKTIVLLLAFILSSMPILAQSIISGKVTDPDKQPISYANVVLKSIANHTTLTGTISDEEGNFEIETNKEDDFLLEVSFMGYKTEQITIQSNANLSLDIILSEDRDTLNEVVIEATKPMIEQKTDRLVFNLEQTVSGSTGTAIDALKVTPGISTQNEVLSIIGKSEVRVLINDRILQLSGEELYEYLKNISADDIEKIEVITTPPAKYEAEGDSGLINIVMKTAHENSWSNTIKGSYKQATYPSYNLGESFLYRKDKLEIAASINGTKGYIGQINDMDIFYEEDTWNNHLKMKRKLDNLSGRFNIDYAFSKNTSIGFVYNGTYGNNDFVNNDHTSIYTNNEEIAQITSEGYSDNNRKTHDTKIYFTQNLDTLGRKLSVSADYFKFDYLQDRSFYSTSNYPGIGNSDTRTSNDQNITNYSFNMDMEHPTSWAQIGYGGKLLFTKTKNLLDGEDFIDEDSSLLIQQDNFNYTENIQSLYFDASKNFNEKWTVKAGVRFENTKAKGLSEEEENNFKRNYTNFFPSSFINYSANENNVFNISYSRRINRPSFYALNPFRWYLNSVSYVEGNPLLQPKISENFEIKHVFKNKLITQLFVSIEKDGFGETPSVDPATNEQTSVYTNYYNSTSFGINQTFMYHPFRWWNSTTQASLSYLRSSFVNDFDLIDKPINGINFRFYTNNNFFLNTDKTIQLEATFMYSPKQPYVLFKMNSMSALNIGIKALFLDKKLETTLSIQDIYKGMKFSAITYTNSVQQVYANYNDSRSITLSMSYKFGNDKLKSKNKELKTNDIKERAQ